MAEGWWTSCSRSGDFAGNDPGGAETDEEILVNICTSTR